MNKTEQLIQAYFANPITEEPLITELRRLAKLNAAYLREVAQWRVRHEAMQRVGADPYPWPDLDDARRDTDAARREAGEV